MWLLNRNFIVFFAFLQITTLIHGNPIDPEIEQIKKYNEKLKNTLNTEIDPCKNFLDYTNGNLELINTKDINLNLKKVEQLLYPFDNKNLNPAEIKAQKFHESCIKANNVSFLIQNNDKIWPITTDDWKPSEDMWTKTFYWHEKEMKEMNHLSILKIRSKKDDIFIHYGFETETEQLLNQIKTDKQKKDVMEAIISREGVNELTAQILLAEIIETSEKIYKALKYCPRNEDWYTQVKVKELKMKIPSIDWNKLLKAESSGKQEINDDTLVTVLDQFCTFDFLKAVTENPRGTYNYMYWLAAETRSKWICHLEIFKYFNAVIFAKFINNYITADDCARYAEMEDQVVENIKDNIKDVWTEFTEEELDGFKKKQKIIIKYITSDLKLEKINEMYTQISIDPNDYEGNVQKLSQNKDVSKIYDCKHENECADIEELSKVSNLIANENGKPLYVAFSNLVPALYRMASEVEEKKLFRKDLYEKLNDCFENKKLEGLVLLKFQEIGEKIVVSNSYKISLNEYEKYLNDLATINGITVDDIFKDSNLTPRQVFFINIAHNYYSNFNDGLALNQILLNMKDFAEAFNCPIGSAMNPTKDNCLKI